MKIFKTLVVGIGIGLLASSSAFADVQVTMQNGRVSLVARDATIRQILTEWARVGQTKIVNLEKLSGGPISLELHDVPESQALDIVLRSLAGYMAAPRPVAVANLSVFDRVVIMPQAAGPRPTAVAAAPQPPAFQQPQLNRQPQPADDQDDDRAPNVSPNRGPVFNTFPQQQQPQVISPQSGRLPQPVVQQPAVAPPSAFPTAPFGGVSVPGMVAPPPPQSTLPGQVPGVIKPGGQ